MTPARDVLACSQGNVIVLMALRTASYHTLDEVGSRVWEAIGAGARREEVIDARRAARIDPVLALRAE